MALSVGDKSRIREQIAKMSRRAASADSDSSSDDGEDTFVPYGQRPEWQNVQPVFQNDGPNPVCAIDYTLKFKNTFDYFRAILAKDERSDRALSLTEDAAALNPANYTVWYYRRVLLKDLNKDLSKELDYVDQVILKSPKNYQVWHHRKVIVELLNDGRREKEFTDKILEDDAKNYHAWQHRQWVLAQFNLFDNELECTDSLIAQDVRNNSAWNHRFYVISRTTTFKPLEVMKRELKFTLSKITLAPNNESPWNYLRGFLESAKEPLWSTMSFCDDLFNANSRAPFLLSYMVDAIEEKLETQVGGGDVKDIALFERALQLTNLLANDCDKIRTEYWQFIQRNLVDTYGTK